jgi:anthranilate phosphoribosyltransferase
VHPSEFGIAKATKADLEGGDATENAAIIRAILRGVKGPERDVVLLNAGVGLFVAERVATVREGIAAAARAIDSGAASETLDKMARASHEVAPV